MREELYKLHTKTEHLKPIHVCTSPPVHKDMSLRTTPWCACYHIPVPFLSFSSLCRLSRSSKNLDFTPMAAMRWSTSAAEGLHSGMGCQQSRRSCTRSMSVPRSVPGRSVESGAKCSTEAVPGTCQSLLFVTGWMSWTSVEKCDECDTMY